MTIFPAHLKLEYQPDSGVRSAFHADIDATLGGAERRFQTFSSEAQRLLDQALSTKRNSVGSLDLGVDQLREAARAQQARAQAAREVAQATAIAAKEEGDYGQAARLAVVATQALAREEEQAARAALAHASAAEQVQERLNRQASATDLVVQSTTRGTNAQQNVINSTRASRVAFVQLGQQMQDVTVQAQMGTSAFTIFAQQVPQAAFALSGLEGSANKTHARIGSFATFLSGPWGAAIFAATAVLGPLVYRLFDSGEAADQSARSQRTLADVLNDETSSYKEVTEALEAYNRAQEKSREITILSIQATAELIQKRLESAIAIRTETQALLDGYNAQLLNPTGRLMEPGEVAAMGAAAAALGSRLSENQSQIDKLTRAAQTVTIQAADEIARIGSSAEAQVKTGFEVLREEARKTIRDVDDLTARLTALNRQETAALDAMREAGRARSAGVSAAAQASVGDMTALIKQLFPGAQITSTTGGRHVKGGDHYAGRAIDFVPGGGMGRYSTAEVEQILRDAGVDIRRNQRGVEQLFGPGRSARRPGDHDDHFHVAWQGGAPDPDKVAQAAQKAEAVLRQFGDRSAESILRINERFDEQPRLIDQAARATRELDAVIAELSERKPPGFEQLIAEAEAAKGTIEDALVRPFREMREESERRLQIDDLITQGRDEEAAILQEIWRIEQQLGTLSEDQRRQVAAIVTEEERRLEINRRLRDEQQVYLDATRSVRSELEAMFAGQGNLSNFGQIFRDLKSRVTVEALFGDTLRELDDLVKGGGKLEGSVDYLASETTRAGEEALGFAQDLNDARRMIAGGYSDGGPRGTNLGAPPPEISPDGTITLNGLRLGTAQGIRESRSALSLTPEAYFELMARRITAPMLEKLDQSFGTQFFSQLQGALSGALYGYASGGAPGGIIGALQGANQQFGEKLFGRDFASTLGSHLGTALQGAQTGTTVAGVGNMLGIGMSKTGSQLGGALGSLTMIPGGDIIGAVAGGILGKLLGSTKYGTAAISGADGYTVRAKGSGRAEGAETMAGAVQEGLRNIADQLGADLGSFRLSIGSYKDSIRVSPGGMSGKLKGGDVVDFGEDQGAAIAFALMDAIRDGALRGLRAGTQRLLTLGDDAEAAVKDALDFESVFKRLRQHKDPVGAAMDDLDDEFGRLKGLFEKAGASTAEWADLEELYWIERDKMIKEATEASLGSLRSLMDELTVGNSALSLRDRKSAALANYNPLAERVAAGDMTAYDDFAGAARALLEIERQLSGSQNGYFDLLDRVTGLTQGALDGRQGAAFATENRDSPFGARGSANDNAGVVSSLDQLRAELAEGTNSHLAAVNQNLGTMIGLMSRAPQVNYGSVDGGW